MDLTSVSQRVSKGGGRVITNVSQPSPVAERYSWVVHAGEHGVVPDKTGRMKIETGASG